MHPSTTRHLFRSIWGILLGECNETHNFSCISLPFQIGTICFQIITPYTHIYNSYCHQLPRDSLSCRTEYVGPQLTKHLLWIVFVYSLYSVLVVCMPHWLVGWLTGSTVAEALNWCQKDVLWLWMRFRAHLVDPVAIAFTSYSWHDIWQNALWANFDEKIVTNCCWISYDIRNLW